MSDTVNISGNWHGNYRYSASPDAGDFRFQARFSQKEGVLTGVIMEENPLHIGRAQADIKGSVNGQTVHFIKTYRNCGETYRFAIDYRGHVSDDATRISGTWELPHDSGTFDMTRKV